MNTDDQGRNLAERPIPAGDLPTVDWECVAGRAFAEKQAAEHEVERLREHMPADVLRVYDRRYHGGP